MAQMTPARRISHTVAAFLAPLAVGLFLGLLGIRVDGLWLPVSVVLALLAYYGKLRRTTARQCLPPAER